jgi:hypothetical protein
MMLVGLLLFCGSAAFAHVTEIRVNQAQDGSLTWYLVTYHASGECGIANSGLTINGVNYPIQSEQAGDASLLSSNIFAQDPAWQTLGGRRSYAIVRTPFLGTTLNVQPYSTNVCWAFRVGGSGNFTPPPPPVCTSCPITGWSNTVAASGNDNNTECNPADDYTTATIKVAHLACANITGDKQFSVVFDPSGANVAYGPFNYAAGVETIVSISVPYGTTSSTPVKVIDADFPCEIVHGLTLPGNAYLGEKETVLPVISCPASLTVNTDPGQCSAVVNYALPTAMDNCSGSAGNQTVSLTINAGCDDGTITFNTPDAYNVSAINFGGAGWYGNVHGHGINVTVTVEVLNAITNTWVLVKTIQTGTGDYYFDNTSITFPAIPKVTAIRFNVNQYIGCAYHISNLPVNLVSTGRTTLTQIAGLPSGSVFPKGVTTNTFTATDEAGNSVSGSFTVTVADNEAPSITAPAALSVSTDAGACSASVTPGNAQFSDNCPGTTIANNAPAVFPKGTTVVTWTATDAAGNVSTATQSVTVSDTEAPVPNAGTAGAASIAGTAHISIPFGYSANWNMYTYNFQDPLPAGATITGASMTWGGQDQGWGGTGQWAGMNVSGTQIGAGQYLPFYQNYNINYSGNIPGYNYGGNNYFRLDFATWPGWVAYIYNGNLTLNYQTVNAGTLPAITAECSATATAPTASDNCGGLITATTSDPLTYSQQGTYTIHWTYTDGDGNRSFQNQDVIIRDVTVPTISTSDITVSNDAGQCGAQVTFAARASDNCGTPTVTYSHAPGSYFPVGATTVTATATDAAANTAVSTFVVTVNDNEGPAVHTQPLTIQLDASGAASVTAAGINNGSVDNCGVASIALDKTSFDCSNVGANTVTLTVTDIHGNTASAQATVTVEDKIAPTVTCPANPPVYCYANNQQYTVPAVSATDNCSIASYAFSISGATSRSGSGTDASGAFNPGTSTILWTVTDVNGNTSTCSTTIVVNPKINASFNDFTLQGGNLNTIYTSTYGPGSAATIQVSANGGSAPYNYQWNRSGTAATHTVGTPASSILASAAGSGTVTFSAAVTDAQGCSSTFAKTIQVVDIRCGTKGDKVMVCQKTGSASNPTTQICVAASAVGAHLNNGATLGSCGGNAVTRSIDGIKPKADAAVAEATVLAYPNPSRGLVNIRISGMTGQVQLVVVDSRGMQVSRRNATILAAQENVQLNLEGVAAGLYTVRVSDGKQVFSTRVVIAR